MCFLRKVFTPLNCKKKQNEKRSDERISYFRTIELLLRWGVFILLFLCFTVGTLRALNAPFSAFTGRAFTGLAFFGFNWFNWLKCFGIVRRCAVHSTPVRQLKVYITEQLMSVRCFFFGVCSVWLSEPPKKIFARLDAKRIYANIHKREVSHKNGLEKKVLI